MSLGPALGHICKSTCDVSQRRGSKILRDHINFFGVGSVLLLLALQRILVQVSVRALWHICGQLSSNVHVELP